MKINTYVLSTAELDHALINKALVHDIELDAMSYIQVEPIRERNLTEEIKDLCKMHLDAVFTSANAINAMSAILKDGKPEWNIYCIGNATKKAALEYFAPSWI